MFKGRNGKNQKTSKEVPVKPDQDALLHEAYMLVRHLRGYYPEASVDQELSLRLSCLFGHLFTPVGVERLLEALQRSFTPTYAKIAANLQIEMSDSDGIGNPAVHTSDVLSS